jgi:hypothetical protein
MRKRNLYLRNRSLKLKIMQILITAALLFLFWLFFGSHLYMIGIVTAGVVLGNTIYHKLIH